MNIVTMNTQSQLISYAWQPYSQNGKERSTDALMIIAVDLIVTLLA